MSRTIRRLVLRLDSVPLFRGNRIRRQAEQEESSAPVQDDDVIAFRTVCIEERPGAIPVNRVASARWGISPVPDIAVGASSRANEAARPISGQVRTTTPSLV